LDSWIRMMARISQICLPKPRWRPKYSTTECAVDPRAAIAQVSITVEEKGQKVELQAREIKNEKVLESLQSSHPKVCRILPLAYSLKRTVVHIRLNKTVFKLITRAL
jgi:hypothetical protein